jgi:hypothetical protein
MANEKMILVPYNKLAIEVVPCYKLANDILCAMNHSIPVQEYHLLICQFVPWNKEYHQTICQFLAKH